MKKFLVILAILLFLIIGTITALFLGIKSYLTPEKVSKLISKKLETAIHHKVKLGPIETGFSSATIQGVTILPNTPNETVPLIHVNTVSLSFSLIPLLQKKLVIGDIVVEAPTIHVVREKDGRLNWQKEFTKISWHLEKMKENSEPRATLSLVPAAYAAEATRPHKAFTIRVDKIGIRNGTLNWEDRTLLPVYKASLTSLQVDVTNFSLKAPFAFKAQARFKRKKEATVATKGTMNLKEKEIQGTATITSLDLQDIAPYLYQYRQDAPAIVSGTGNLTLQLSTKGWTIWHVEEKLTLTSLILSKQRQKSPPINADLTAIATLDRDKGLFHLKELEGKILNSDFTLTGTLKGWKGTASPVGSFSFTSNKMDVDTLLGLGGILALSKQKNDNTPRPTPSPIPRKKSPQKKGKKLPNVSIPSLPRLTIRASIHLLTFHGMKIEEVNAKALTKNTVVIIDPFTANLYGGTIKGKAHIDLQGGLLSIRKEVSLKDIGIAPLLADMNPHGKEKFSGQFFGNAKGEGIIGATSTYMGDISFHIERGEIQNVTFLEMAAGIMKLPSLAHLKFDVLDGKARIANKKIDILSTRAKGKDIAITTHGTVGFDKKMNLHATMRLPYKVVRKGLGKRSDLFKDTTDSAGKKWSIIPLKIKGTFEHPKVAIKFQKEAVDKIIDKNIHDKKLKKILKKLFK